MLSYGMFINNLIKFFLTAMALFLVVKAMNRFKRKEEAEAPAAPPEAAAAAETTTPDRAGDSASTRLTARPTSSAPTTSA